MKINIDFLLSGCNTRCKHCYVAGGPGPFMAAADALLCMEKLDALAALLPGETTFTLDHEPVNHPYIVRLIQAAAKTEHIQNYHHGMTSGIALMRRKDRDAVIRTYMDLGYRSFGITIHGSAGHHDEIVRHKGAYETAVEAARYFKSKGARLEISLMINRFFPEDADELSGLLERLQPDYTGLVIPIFTPHRHMMDFEPYRASLSDLEALAGYPASWGLDETAFLANARELTISSAISRLRGGTVLQDLFAVPQDELYLTLHQNGVLYMGNTGAETRCIGDLRTMAPEEAARVIRNLPGNRDYGAFYEPGMLPSAATLMEALENLPGNLVYGDFESAVYRGLAALEVPTVILSSYMTECKREGGVTPPTREEIMEELEKYGITARGELYLIDTSHDDNDIRLNCIIDRKWVLRFCTAPEMTEQRLREMNRLIERYLRFGLLSPRFLTDGEGHFLHKWQGLTCYLSEYIDLPTADMLPTGEQESVRREVEESIARFAETYRNVELIDTMGMYSLFDLSPFDRADGRDEKQQNFENLCRVLRDIGEENLAARLEVRHAQIRRKLRAVYHTLPRCVFQADGNLSNVLVNDAHHMAGLIDFNLAGTEVIVNQFANLDRGFMDEVKEPVGAEKRLAYALESFREYQERIFRIYHADETEKQAMQWYRWIALVSGWRQVCFFFEGLKNEKLKGEVLELLGFLSEMP